MAYLAAAAVPHGEYELGCAKDMGGYLCCCEEGWVCGGRRIGTSLQSSVSLGFEEGLSGWVGYHYTSL